MTTKRKVPKQMFFNIWDGVVKATKQYSIGISYETI